MLGASAAQDRRAGEPDEPDEEHPAPAERSPSDPPSSTQAAERDQVGVEHPLQAAEAASRSSAMAGRATLTMVPSRNGSPSRARSPAGPSGPRCPHPHAAGYERGVGSGGDSSRRRVVRVNRGELADPPRGSEQAEWRRSR